MMAIWKIGPALAAGCTTVLKPAPTTPLTARPAGRARGRVFPPGVLNVVVGGNDAGRGAGRAPRRRDGLADRIGRDRQVGRRARRARPSSGSTSSLAARRRCSCSTTPTSRPRPEAIAGFGYYNAGQDCTAATRVLAGADLRRLRRRPRRKGQGRDRRHPHAETTLGPLNIRAPARPRRGFVEREPDHAELVTGGTEPDRPGSTSSRPSSPVCARTTR